MGFRVEKCYFGSPSFPSFIRHTKAKMTVHGRPEHGREDRDWRRCCHPICNDEHLTQTAKDELNDVNVLVFVGVRKRKNMS